MTRARMSEIVDAASERFDIPVALIIGRPRRVECCRPRFAACLIGHRAGHSLSEIGRYLNRDHTSVANGIERAVEMMKTDADFAEAVEKMDAALGQAPRFYRHGSFQFRSVRRKAA